MKQQYFGDINDYRKYGLLRCFSEAGFRLGVHWMSTADDGRSDGQRTTYLRDPGRWRRSDPRLFDFLADTVLLQGRRDIALFERSGLLLQGIYHSALLTESADERSICFGEALRALEPADMIFFDPDNGLEVRSVPYGTTGSHRYLYWHEVDVTWAAGHSLLIFQHFNRQARVAFSERLSAKVQARTAGSCVAAAATSHVLFLAAIQPAHLDRLDLALTLISEQWSGQVTMTKRPAVSNDLESLCAAGFGGFVSIRELRANKLRDVPDEMGVYLVLRLTSEAPIFLERSPGGHFKGKDPTIPIEEVHRNWVPGTPVIYIGKAGGPAEDATLQSRLDQYLAFGAGRRVGHYGGRLIWQLADAEDLVVCWKATPTEVPREVEQRLIEKFKQSHSGKRPFANLQD